MKPHAQRRDLRLTSLGGGFVTRALLWKERREFRRVFAFGLFVLVGLPVALMIVIQFVSDSAARNEIAGTSVVLAIFAGPLIASALGAYAVCKDLSRPHGPFLFAQPVSAGRIILLKGAVATLVFLWLMIAPGVAELIMSAVDSRISAEDWLGDSIVYLSYVLALTGVLGVSFLAAALIKKLVAAILVGLIASTLFVILPFLYAMEFSRLWDFSRTLAAWGGVGLLIFACAVFGAVSIFSAALFRKSVAALLIALTTLTLFVVVPAVYVMGLLPWKETRAIFAVLGSAGLFIDACAVCAAAFVARRPDHAGWSIRRLSWAAVIFMLICTSLVSDNLATDTRFVARVDYPRLPNPAIWARSGSVFWLGLGASNDDSVYLGRATPDQLGGSLQECRVRLDGVYGTTYHYSGGLGGRLSADGKSLILSHCEFNSNGSGEHRVETSEADLLTRFSVNCDRKAAQGERLARWEGRDLPLQSEKSPFLDPWVQWAVDGDALFVLRTEHDDFSRQTGDVLVQCFSLTGERPALLSELPLDALASVLEVKNGVLNSWAAATVHPSYNNVEHAPPRLCRIDVSDPAQPHVVLVSREYPHPTNSSSIQWHTPIVYACAIQGDRLAMASTGGLWLYDLEADGSWTLIGHRGSNWIERLAGRRPLSIDWKDNRIYELCPPLGLIVYDVGNPKRPVRVAHTNGEIGGVCPIDENTIALVRNDLGDVIEIHKLPD